MHAGCCSLKGLFGFMSFVRLEFVRLELVLLEFVLLEFVLLEFVLLKFVLLEFVLLEFVLLEFSMWINYKDQNVDYLDQYVYGWIRSVHMWIN
jgi:hypothetical protein